MVNPRQQQRSAREIPKHRRTQDREEEDDLYTDHVCIGRWPAGLHNQNDLNNLTNRSNLDSFSNLAITVISRGVF